MHIIDYALIYRIVNIVALTKKLSVLWYALSRYEYAKTAQMPI